MIITIDLDECCGHGRCEEAAPDVFGIRADGLAFLLIESPAEDRRAAVEQAARECPANAITVQRVGESGLR